MQGGLCHGFQLQGVFGYETVVGMVADSIDSRKQRRSLKPAQDKISVNLCYRYSSREGILDNINKRS